MYFYNISIPVLLLFVSITMILDNKKYLNVFNGGIGIILGGLIGIKLGQIIFNNIIGSIIVFFLFMIIGYNINKIKKIENILISGISWGLFAIILFSVLNVQTGGLIFFGVFFALSGAAFSYFYYSEILMMSGYSFIGANIIFISAFYGLDSLSNNMFAIFYYPFSFYKFIHLYRINFFFFLLISIFFIVFSIYFQEIKNKKSVNKKTKVLNNVLNEAGYIYAIFFFLTESFRIISGNDSLFIFGISHLNWPIFTFLTYWFIAFVKKQEQIDSMIDQKKWYKPVLYIFTYSIILIPIISFLTNFGNYSLMDFINNMWISIPKLLFTLIIMPMSIYLLYPKMNIKK